MVGGGSNICMREHCVEHHLNTTTGSQWQKKTNMSHTETWNSEVFATFLNILIGVASFSLYILFGEN